MRPALPPALAALIVVVVVVASCGGAAKILPGGRGDDDDAVASSGVAETTPRSSARRRYPVDASTGRFEAPATGAAALLGSSGPTLQEVEAILQRHHERHQNAKGIHQEDRDLIYNGQPTGGNKYPSLVSFWSYFPIDSTTLISAVICHGVMITNDVFVAHKLCGVVLTGSRIALVGDYDSSRPLSESAQLRAVGYFAYNDSFEIIVGLLTEPATFPGFAPAAMNDNPENPLPYQNVTVVGYNGNASFVIMNTSNQRFPAFVRDGIFCAEAVAPQFAVPCTDDNGGPVFDEDRVLLGYTLRAGCATTPAAIFLNATLFKTFAQQTACRISFSDVLPFPCPDFACPPSAVEVGYPWAEIPDLTFATRWRNGFVPATFSQSPRSGTIVRYNTTTRITLAAFDAAGRSRYCSTAVIVPPLVQCGVAEVNITEGSYSREGVFKRNSGILTGTVYKMRGYIQDALSGKGSVIARLRKGSNKYNGEVVFKSNQTKGLLNNLIIPVDFSFLNASTSLAVQLQVRNNTNPGKNYARFNVYCQKVFKV